ncbi:hypothetical protein PA27867_1213 [Cryobacterium arcticum]|uniref:DUF4238 domain-containing protein n=2 Tax=Cryobacterium arcticum TaxID=670052 RepID=A0A1B1BHW4_9MICO|nr:hypothetical protein PA27867_1213 [Cryobacterium arcticum]
MLSRECSWYSRRGTSGCETLLRVEQLASSRGGVYPDLLLGVLRARIGLSPPGAVVPSLRPSSKREGLWCLLIEMALLCGLVEEGFGCCTWGRLEISTPVQYEKNRLPEACEIVPAMDQALPAHPQSHAHHTVPQFWLKQFADSQSSLKMFAVSDNKLVSGRARVRNATVHQDLSVLDSWFETHDIDEKKLFGPIEGRAAKALAPLWSAQDLSTVWPLPQRARNDIATFLAASVVRTPKYRLHADADLERQVARKDRSIHAIDLVRSGAIVGDPDDLARVNRYYGLWQEGDKAPSNVQSDYMRTELPKLARHLFNQRWVLMQAPEPTYVISDNPVALTGQPMTSGPPRFYSVDSLDSRMSITALSRTLLLMTDWHPRQVLATLDFNGDSIIPFDAGRANIARATLILNAEAQFFEHPDDRMVEDIWALRGPDNENNR